MLHQQQADKILALNEICSEKFISAYKWKSIDVLDRCFKAKYSQWMQQNFLCINLKLEEF